MTKKSQKFLTKKSRNYPDLLEFFKNEINQAPNYKEVVRKYLPTLAPGISGSAVHPIIHLGFGIDFEDSEVTIAEGLAYLTHSFLCLTTSQIDFQSKEPTSSESLDLSQVVAQIYEDKELWNNIRTTDAEGFQSKLKTLKNSKIDFYISKWKALHTPTKSLEERQFLFDKMCQELAEVSVFAFYYTDPPSSDFFLLHGVTGCYATICAAKLLDLDDGMKLLYYFCYTLLATYIVEGSPDVLSCSKNPEHPFSPVQNWKSITDEVVALNTDKNDVVCLAKLWFLIDLY